MLACGDSDGNGSGTPTGGSPTGSASGTTTTPDVPVEIITVTWASQNARDLGTLIGSSTHVFLGSVDELSGMRTEEVELPRASEPTVVPVSIFDVTVDTAYKGEFDDGSAVVEQVGGRTTDPEGEEKIVLLDSDELVRAGETYLFFSIEKENGTLNTPPFGRFHVQDDGTLMPVFHWTELAVSRLLAGLTETEAGNEIQSAME